MTSYQLNQPLPSPETPVTCLPNEMMCFIFEKLSAHDRLSCSQVCSNLFDQVREVNKNVRCLNIFTSSKAVDFFCFDYEDQEKLEPSTEWNSLYFSVKQSGRHGIGTGAQLNSTTVQQIMAAFHAVTELNFRNYVSSLQFEYLAQMLESGNQNSWGHQLTTLRIEGKDVANDPTIRRLFSAINRLPALTQLAILFDRWEGFTMLNLPVFARLKEVRFKGRKIDLIPFLRSVQRYAADNADLRINLPEAFPMLVKLLEPTNAYAALLDEHIRERIVRVNSNSPLLIDRKFCTSFPSLTYLALKCSPDNECEKLFALISRYLPHLNQLKMFIDFKSNKNRYTGGTDDDFEIGQILTLRPVTPMVSVRSLALEMDIDSHTDLQWLDLPVTMPNLARIHFDLYTCKRCNIINMDLYIPVYIAVQLCLETVLSPLSRSTGVSLEQISVRGSSGNILTAKCLLLAENARKNLRQLPMP